MSVPDEYLVYTKLHICFLTKTNVIHYPMLNYFSEVYTTCAYTMQGSSSPSNDKYYKVWYARSPRFLWIWLYQCYYDELSMLRSIWLNIPMQINWICECILCKHHIPILSLRILSCAKISQWGSDTSFTLSAFLIRWQPCNISNAMDPEMILGCIKYFI